MPNLYFLIVGIISAIIGAACIVILIRQRIVCSKKTAAEVISVQRRKIGYWRGKTLHKLYPTYRFKADEKVYNVKYKHHVRSTACKIGKQAVIRYDPDNPEKIRVGVNISAYAGAFAMLLCGIIITVCYFI